jgi:transposase
VENNNYIIALPIISPVNNHDTTLLPEALENLREAIDYLRLETDGSHLTLDSGFDSARNEKLIREQNLVPVIKPNPRGCGDEKRYELLDQFEEVKKIYKERYRVERNFAWKTKYRKLVVRQEQLQCIHLGFRNLAYAMINFREIFGKP